MAKGLSVKGLKVAYGNIEAVHGVSFEVNEGEIVTLIGANGAGKSTILRAVSGMIPVKEGTVILNGTEITSWPSHQITGLGMAHVPEGRGIFTRLTVLENLLVGAFKRKDKKEIDGDLDYVLGLFPRLNERKKQLAGTLSGGEQQMLAVGRALMTGADILLLDEPSMGLAPVLVESIFNICIDIAEAGKTILLVEQNAAMALAIADRGYVLETGSIAIHGDAEYLSKHPDVLNAYLGGAS
ncbi:branched-chain amino acid transport ATP-binding protein LivF [Desulfocucumis palustris]|uniref:Branched-chain amino acid transport ATP-binding protein LivF n=1 Tax=Desulfocucumis palustris TaxID=1898651 RepID=A0A2L2XGL0_9FIRM|nr:ABC transporter ATP-binding protein [Desulfocucumis palustris]GBF35282.1 branched-chain amino acid transport ATP-binding protein LivF [Desulfocucumis palustris]